MNRAMAMAGDVGRALLDFALPPRCPTCSTIIDAGGGGGRRIEKAGNFCPDCWPKVQFLKGGCAVCGIPLDHGEVCAGCLARPPRIDRTRSALAYDDMARSIALKLKYGRKVGLARVMARYMATHRGEWGAEAVVTPVPLHWRRLWWRGFNQSMLVAAELGRRWGVEVDPRLVARVRATRPLKGMDPAARRRELARAFAVPDPARVKGRTVVLIDDVLTSGATSDACARVLKRAGAARVELISWARVVHPPRFVR